MRQRQSTLAELRKNALTALAMLAVVTAGAFVVVALVH
jgi:hypothetical protein